MVQEEIGFRQIMSSTAGHSLGEDSRLGSILEICVMRLEHVPAFGPIF